MFLCILFRLLVMMLLLLFFCQFSQIFISENVLEQQWIVFLKNFFSLNVWNRCYGMRRDASAICWWMTKPFSILPQWRFSNEFELFEWNGKIKPDKKQHILHGIKYFSFLYFEFWLQFRYNQLHMIEIVWNQSILIKKNSGGNWMCFSLTSFYSNLFVKLMSYAFFSSNPNKIQKQLFKLVLIYNSVDDCEDELTRAVSQIFSFVSEFIGCARMQCDYFCIPGFQRVHSII